MKENFIDKVFNEECLQGLKNLPDNSVDCCVTSPPYYALRSYAPNLLRLKDDAPQWVKDKLNELNVKPYDFTE